MVKERIEKAGQSDRCGEVGNHRSRQTDKEITLARAVRFGEEKSPKADLSPVSPGHQHRKDIVEN